MNTIPGVDYSSGHPGGAALAAAGKAFAARYVSHTALKNISLAEATDLAAHGVSTVLVWETTANRAGAGRSAGIQDAHDALEQATAAGMLSDRPLYFAVDWDADPTVVAPYFQGVASVLGLPRVGGYGGYKVIRYLFDHALISYGWQTAAWSAGKWDPRAAIRQGAQKTIGGVACDLNTATAPDYGQWMPGKSPLVEDDVATLDADDRKFIETTVQTAVNALLKIRLVDPTDAKGGTKYVGDYIRYADQHAADILAAIQEQTVPAVTDEQIKTLAAQMVASPTFAAAIGKAVVDIEAARLQS